MKSEMQKENDKETEIRDGIIKLLYSNQLHYPLDKNVIKKQIIDNNIIQKKKKNR